MLGSPGRTSFRLGPRRPRFGRRVWAREIHDAREVREGQIEPTGVPSWETAHMPAEVVDSLPQDDVLLQQCR